MTDNTNRRRLTKGQVDRLKPGQRLWATEPRGFGVRCQRSDKVYILKYRISGRQRWYTIGTHGRDYTLEGARKEAERLRGIIASGVDPADVRSTERQDITVHELCDRYFAAAKSGQIVTRFGEPKKSSTIATDMGRIERHIKPLLGKKRLRNITSQDIRRFQADIANGKTAVDVKTGPRGRAIVEGGRGTASRTVGLLGGIFSYAVEEGLRADNPVRDVRRYRDKKNERFLSTGEISSLGQVLAEAEEKYPAAVDAIRLLILTGARKSEILTLQWAFIDFEHAYMRLPSTKTGARDLPLGAPAIKILSRLYEKRRGSFVLPAERGERHYTGLPKIWMKLRAMAGLEGVRLHDLRHSFASIAAAGGESIFIVGSLLGHKDSSTTQRYAHLSEDPRRAAADRISSTISGALSGRNAVVVKDLTSRKQ